jgi:hypothetical protein
MGYTSLFQRKPPGASCNWVKEEMASGTPYRRWRGASGQGCTMQLLQIQGNTGGTPYISVAPPSTSWWTGGFAGCYRNGSTTVCCATANGYLTTSSTSVRINVWKALADGLWSSSIAFNVYPSYDAAGARDLAAGPDNSFSGAASITPAIAVKTLASNAEYPTRTTCTGSVFSTLTVYDDGRLVWT